MGIAGAAWAERPVLVTGATGLVGSWLVKALLAGGARVTALVRDMDPLSELARSGDARRVSIVNGRLERYADVERAVVESEPDAVFHLGAQTLVGPALRSPLATFESNIRGSYNLLEACRVHRVPRVVVASSDKAYGESKSLPYDETMPPLGRHPYDVSKSCTDLLAQAYFVSYGLPVAVARCGNIYGGGDLNWSRLVPGTIRSLLRGERPVIRSDGAFKRDYVYVEDAVEAYLRMAEALGDREGIAGEAFNFGPSEPLSVLAVVETLQRLMGCEHLAPDVRNEARAEIRDQFLDSGKAARVLGVRPELGLDAGLAKTIDWYRGALAEVA